jgi:choline dehydrogenase-like flavoprotein
MSEATDAVVVGAGAGGAVAAWALVRRGIRVTLLDTGPRFSPRAYDTWARDWELRSSALEEVEAAPARKSYESAPRQPLRSGFEHLASRSPSVFARPGRRFRSEFFYNRALGGGGTTLHYQGAAHRFPAHAFRMRSERGVAADWPITYDELAPYYERIEHLLGVAGDPQNPFKPARGPYPYPAHPLSPLSETVARAAKQLGLHVLPNPVAILPTPREGRSVCHYCNGCVRGCPVNAKGSVDVAVIPPAEATGRLTILTNFHVTRLEHDGNRRITGAVGVDEHGNEQRVVGRAYFLATGAIETPRILLQSGVGNDEDQVGRYLMESLYVGRRGTLDGVSDTHLGIPFDSRIWDGNGATGEGEIANGFVLGHGCGSLQGPVQYALRAIDGFGASHRDEMRRRFGAGAELVGIVEQFPRAENRVTLAETADRHGKALARVTARLDRTDLEALSFVWKRLADLGAACGLKSEGHQTTAYDVSNVSHVAGTCRMGTDPRTSVTDAFGGVHGFRNLCVTDASVLVTQGSGDSPSLTVQALALRAAEAFAERAARGDA